MSQPIPPVIIVGMHRSGTTMVTKMLDHLGLFVGDKKEINHEALFFWHINNWIFDIAHSRADLPHNFRYLNPAAQRVLETDLKWFTQSFRRYSYLGWDKFFRYKDIRDLDIPWGWKDPKNSFTIDLWKSVFPDAKVLHIYRNPIDSISSFIERDLEMKNRFRHNWKKQLKRALLVSHQYHTNFRLHSLQEGYNLWEEYVSKCLSLEADFPAMKHVRYEDFLAEPAVHLKDIALFCGLQPSEEAIQKEVASVKSDRAFAFVQHPEAKAAYLAVKDRPIMQQLGYDNILL
jgi:hypothetical protein